MWDQGGESGRRGGPGQADEWDIWGGCSVIQEMREPPWEGQDAWRSTGGPSLWCRVNTLLFLGDELKSSWWCLEPGWMEDPVHLGTWGASVGRKMVLYENCLQRQIGWPEHIIIIILKSTMNLTCKNWGFYYNSGGRIKLWSFRSASNIVVHILKNQVNSYDSNGVIAIPISTLGDEKRNLLFFCLPIFFPRNSLNVLGHIIRRWKDIFKENTTLLESWETVQNWWRNSGNQFYEFEP